MNYYAQGGQAHGLKSLAQDLRSYGRNGDTMLAHITPQEAGILKSLGGSGTINPDTGLPEYFFKAVSRAVAAPFKAVNEVVKAVPIIGPAIDRGLVGLDKAVGNTIPGGWNTLAQTALAFTPLGMPLKVGLAALGGSGAFGPNGKFNLQRALMSGAMAYGANQLTAGLQAAGGAGADATASQIASNLGVEGASALPGSQAAMLAEQAAGLGQAGLGNIASSAGYNALPVAGANTFAFNAAGEMVPANIAPQITGATANIAPSAAPSAMNSFLSQTGENLAAAGRGVANLSGFGTGAGTAASEFVKPVTTAGMTALAMGTMGTMQLDEQQKLLDQQLASGSIAQSEYDAQAARIADARARAEQAVRDNPYQFAVGGSVDDESGMDDVRGMYQGNMQKGLFGKGYAAGGQIDMGNGYNPFSNLPPMSGPLGAAGQLPTAQNQPSFARSPYGIGPSSVNTTTEQDMTGGNRNGISGGLSSIFSGLGGSTPFNSSILNATPQPLGGQFAHNTQQIPTQPIYNSSIDQYSNAASGGGSSGYPSTGGYGGGGAFPLQGQYGIVKMAQGGNVSTSPRFLSGGGDGMSDSIPATINGRQEARLADGEFVVPADVVSHLGNGSSKAGAKRLYSMMDKVRTARTGTKKQGKQINPNKFMPA
jgi:hypothetical protein